MSSPTARLTALLHSFPPSVKESASLDDVVYLRGSTAYLVVLAITLSRALNLTTRHTVGVVLFALMSCAGYDFVESVGVVLK